MGGLATRITAILGIAAGGGGECIFAPFALAFGRLVIRIGLGELVTDICPLALTVHGATIHIIGEVPAFLFAGIAVIGLATGD